MYRFEQTGELSAQSEEGRVYRILEYTKFLNLADAHTPSRWEAVGPEEYRSGVESELVKLSEADVGFDHVAGVAEHVVRWHAQHARPDGGPAQLPAAHDTQAWVQVPSTRS